MRTRSKLGIVALGLGVAALSSTSLPRAFADAQAQQNDAVIVGSDTLQFGTNFVADGDDQGDAGYNSSKTNRIFDFFATGDANGRATGAGGTTGAVLSNPVTTVLRAGTEPVLRPNGSGAGIADLTLDANGSFAGLPADSITLARASRLPTKTVSTGTAEDTTCDNTTGCGGFHVYEIAKDTLGIAALSSGSNAVPLDAQQLWNIYNCTSGYQKWSDANVGGTSSDPIVPVIPQSGSGTRTFFLQTIDALSGHGTTDPSLSTNCVKTAQEHDPTGITSQSGSYTSIDGTNGTFNYTSADAVEPFSAARLSLINTDNYFVNSGSTTAGTPANGYAQNLLSLLSGTPKDPQPVPTNGSNGLFSTVRAVYLIARVADLSKTCTSKTTPACFVPGGTQTAVQALISGGSNSVFRNTAYATDLQTAGFTPAFQDCGVDPDNTVNSQNACVQNP